MKLKLQARAEAAARRFASARRPLVFEFAGVPRAGKTSTIQSLQKFLKQCGFGVEVVKEKASECPIRDKQHSNFNVWTACATLNDLLEKTQNPPKQGDPDILLLDRGLFDSVCWFSFMAAIKKVSSKEHQTIENFLLLPEWRKRIAGVFVMLVDPEDALARERTSAGQQKNKKAIMTEAVLGKMLERTKDASARFGTEFPIFQIDTSVQRDPQEVVETIANQTVAIIEEHLREDILCLDRDRLFSGFSGVKFFSKPEAERIIQEFHSSGEFLPRETVETDASKVQALPIVVIRRRNGDVLRLKRREQDPANPLHEKAVIWAGGHARKEDKNNGETLIECALRELDEELRLSLTRNELMLQGAVYSALNPKSAKHVGIVYEWCVDSDAPDIVLNSSEFFERRGISLSGSFASVNDLAEAVENREITEEWSVLIIREVLAKGKFTFSPTLI